MPAAGTHHRYSDRGRASVAIGALESDKVAVTKLREPVSIENALLQLLGELTIERAAEVTSRAPGYLHAAADPAKRQELTVKDLLALDQAHDAQHGRGFPLFEALGRQLESARGDRFADAAVIGASAIAIAREGGEASAALLELALDGTDSDAKLDLALREAEQADRATDEAVAVLRAVKARRASARAPP